MDKFLDEIRAAAAADGVEPALLIKRAAPNSVSGKTWANWTGDKASPTMRLADRVRDYIATREAARAAAAESDASNAV